MLDITLSCIPPNPVTLNPTLVRTIAAKDIRDALRDRFILIVTGFLGLAALVALVTGAIAPRGDVATYEAAKASLLALGKSVMRSSRLNSTHCACCAEPSNRSRSSVPPSPY